MLKEYIRQFTEQDVLPQGEVITLGDRYFLVPSHVNFNQKEKPVYCGLYLGKKYNNKFVPGVDLLRLVSVSTDKSVVVNEKAEWLVICGRDVWGPSVVKSNCSLAPDMKALVLNQHREVLGVGRVIETNLKKKGVAIKMQFDIGDLIRRGKKLLQKRGLLL